MIIIGLGLVGYAHFIEPNLLMVNRVTMQTVAETKPFTLTFFSDTHFGSLYDPKKVEDIVEKINAQQSDLVIFGGDFFDAYAKDQATLDLAQMAAELQKIEAPYGKYAIWGNHDYGGGASRVYQKFMEDSGFTLLKNAVQEIAELQLSLKGLDDYLLGFPDTSAQNFSKENFGLVVTHAPDIVDEMDLSNVDLVVAGHSHGGQVSIPWLTDNVLPPGAQSYVKGTYALETPRGTKLFVSKGLGLTKLSYRFLNIPEIVVLQVKSAEK